MNKQTMFYHIVNCLEKKQKGNTDETKPPLNLEPLHSNEKRWWAAARSWYSEIVLLVVGNNRGVVLGTTKI